MLKTVAVAGLGATLPGFAFGQNSKPPAWRSALLTYLQSLARPDGGYAWEDQEQSHLTPTFAVIGCYRLLNLMPPHPAAVAEFVRTHHPGQLRKLEQEHREFEYQQIQSLLWLGEDAASFRERVSGWKKPTAYLKQYEQHSWPIFRHELTAFTCRALLGLPLEPLAPEYVAYLNSRRRANGSFNNTPEGGDGHVLNTWWGVRALQVLGRLEEKKPETIAWLRACQLANGGFTWQPQPDFAGTDDVAYTWAAVRSLQMLGAAPAARADCLAYLRSLANADGGFGDRPGWLSNPLATYYALDAASALGELDCFASAPRPPRPRRQSLPAGLKLYSIQIEAHGQGSPAEAVDLARALRIHFWGAKNGTPEWLARAQALADRQQVPVQFFVANEEYGTWVQVPGLGTYSHTSDLIAPPHCDFGPALGRPGAASWPEFRQRRLGPLQQAQGRLIWQFGENEELVRLYLDDSLQRGGYAAISTFHFGNPDFTNSEPFLQRYRGRIPFIGLQDSHGDEPWWFADKTTGFRTVFLASEPSWQGWLTALERNWVAAIRHDAVSGFKTWMHAGSKEVLEFVRDHEREWRWWDNAPIQRPLVSLVAVTPEDPFEAARPEQGVTLRVRCAWECAPQGQLKQPLAELLKLTLDGAAVSPKLVTRHGGRGAALVDHYHEFHLEPSPGKHTARALVRVAETGLQASRTIEFVT